MPDMVPLSQHARVSLRQRFDEIGSHQRSLADALGGHIAGQAMQVDAQAKHALPVLGAKFRGETGQAFR